MFIDISFISVCKDTKKNTGSARFSSSFYE